MNRNILCLCEEYIEFILHDWTDTQGTQNWKCFVFDACKKGNLNFTHHSLFLLPRYCRKHQRGLSWRLFGKTVLHKNSKMPLYSTLHIHLYEKIFLKLLGLSENLSSFLFHDMYMIALLLK